MVDPALGAVILAGGAGQRLGGTDKPGIVVDGRTLLDTAIGSCAGCAEIVVVGPRRESRDVVQWTREEPPSTGPLAALAAGIEILTDAVQAVTVLAADLPAVTADTVSRLHRTLESSDVDAVLLADRTGRQQPLTAVYVRAALDAALDVVGDPRGQPFRSVLAHLRIATLVDPSAGEDIDTADDLARWVEHGRAGTVGDAPLASQPTWKEQT